MLLGSAATVVLGCHEAQRRRDALEQIDEARHRLAELAPYAAGWGRDSVALSRQALLEAENALRREGAVEALVSDEPSWEAPLRRGLDSVEIAEWVVERELLRQREDADCWLDVASSALSDARRARVQRIHFTAESRLRRAEASLVEARRLRQQGDFSRASDKAKEAASLAGALSPEAEAMVARLVDPANVRHWEVLVRKVVDESRARGGEALVVDKSEQVAALFVQGKPARMFPVELGYNGLSQKLRAGDGATPEGIYRVTRRKGRGDTRYYRALLLDYPNAEDRIRFRHARARGEIERSASIGGLIEIHGEGGRGRNWTDGCIALTNSDMDYLFERLGPGSPVVIVGRYRGERWAK